MSQFASVADDQGAQLAFAIEAITDELERILLELVELRALVDEQQSLLDDLKVYVLPKPPSQDFPACTWRLLGS